MFGNDLYGKERLRLFPFNSPKTRLPSWAPAGNSHSCKATNLFDQTEDGTIANSHDQQVVLCEVLDRVLNKGVLLSGSVVVSVADIDLLYVGLDVLLTSVETARASGKAR